MGALKLKSSKISRILAFALGWKGDNRLYWLVSICDLCVAGSKALTESFSSFKSKPKSIIPLDYSDYTKKAK